MKSRTICALLALAMWAPALSAAAPAARAFYCRASVPHTTYLTGIFTTAAVDNRDVASAWKLYLDNEHIVPELTPMCFSLSDVTTAKTNSDGERASAASANIQIVDVDWKFANQVPTSDPHQEYGYCQTGTSLADTTYFSDVFGVPMGLPSQRRVDVTTPFLQYLRSKYGDLPGLAAGAGPGPQGQWCQMLGNIADTERDKKDWEDKLRGSRKIVETGWRYSKN